MSLYLIRITNYLFTKLKNQRLTLPFFPASQPTLSLPTSKGIKMKKILSWFNNSWKTKCRYWCDNIFLCIKANKYSPSIRTFRYICKGGIYPPSTTQRKRICEVRFEDEAKKFIQAKYGLNSHTINKIDWELHSIQYKKLTSSRKRSVAIFIHHRLPSGNMMFEYKHRCPICQLNSTPNRDHDHF